MKYKYNPQPVRKPKVHHTLFGPSGRKWLDLHGLEGRFKIAQTPEGESVMGGDKTPSKPTARVPGSRGSRNQVSGDLNASKPQQPATRQKKPSNVEKPSINQEGEAFQPPQDWTPEEDARVIQEQGMDWEPGQDELGEFDLDLESETPEESELMELDPEWETGLEKEPSEGSRDAAQLVNGVYPAVKKIIDDNIELSNPGYFDSRDEYIYTVVQTVLDYFENVYNPIDHPDELDFVQNAAAHEARFRWSEWEKKKRRGGRE